MFPAEAPVGPAEGADLALHLLVLQASLRRARAREEIAAAEPEIPVDLARTLGRLPEAVQKPAKRADGETRLPEFAAAVPHEGALLGQWLWKRA